MQTNRNECHKTQKAVQKVKMPSIYCLPKVYLCHNLCTLILRHNFLQRCSSRCLWAHIFFTQKNTLRPRPSFKPTTIGSKLDVPPNRPTRFLYRYLLHLLKYLIKKRIAIQDWIHKIGKSQLFSGVRVVFTRLQHTRSPILERVNGRIDPGMSTAFYEHLQHWIKGLLDFQTSDAC